MGVVAVLEHHLAEQTRIQQGHYREAVPPDSPRLQGAPKSWCVRVCLNLGLTSHGGKLRFSYRADQTTLLGICFALEKCTGHIAMLAGLGHPGEDIDDNQFIRLEWPVSGLVGITGLPTAGYNGVHGLPTQSQARLINHRAETLGC